MSDPQTPACSEVRPQLGELLLGALEAPEPLLEHVADCSSCALELTALHELEAALTLGASPRPLALAASCSGSPQRALGAPGAPARSRRAAWAVGLVCAAAAGLGLGALLAGRLGPPPPPARVLEGSARGQGRATAGDALPVGRVVAGAEGLTLRLSDGSAVYASPGAALTLTNTRALRLHRGRARFSVVPDPSRPFRVETPRAPVRVLGTVFDVHVEEVVVAGTGIKAAGLAVVVGVSVLTGAVMFGEGGDAVEVAAGQAALADERGVRRVAVGTQALAEAEDAQRAAEAEQAGLTARNKELEDEAANLRARVAELEAQLAQQPAPEQADTGPSKPTRRVFTFGDPSPERSVLEKLDWETPAKSIQTMLPLLTKYHALLSKGESPDQDLQIAIYKANSKLVEAYIEVKGKLPTHAQSNGEYVHPAFMANLVDAYLEGAGQPLDEGQRARIDDLGRAHDAAWEQAQLGYTEQTVKTRKLYDELMLKAEFRAGLDRVLSGSQLALLGDENLRHVSGMDLFSPVLVFSASTRVVAGADTAELLTQLQNTLNGLGIDPATPGAERVLGDWLALAVSEPVAKDQTWSYTLDEGMRALNAQATAFEQLTQLALSEEQLESLRSSGWTVLPRLTTPE